MEDETKIKFEERVCKYIETNYPSVFQEVVNKNISKGITKEIQKNILEEKKAELLKEIDKMKFNDDFPCSFNGDEMNTNIRTHMKKKVEEILT